MDRYGNQFATRVEVNVEAGVISADVLYTPQGMYGLSIGGVILAVQYASQEDAIDAADVILGRLAKGELVVVNLPVGSYGYDEYEGDHKPWSGDSSAVAHAAGSCDDECNWCISGVSPQDVYADDYPGQVLPTGWDAQDHKSLYE